MYEFSSKYPAAISLVLFIAAAGASYFSYRKRDLNRVTKTVLVTLRALAIFLILVLFIEPSVLATIKKKNEIRNVILIDDSRSNNLIMSGGKLKTDKIKEYLSANNTTQNGEKIYTFSSLLKKYDSLKGDGYRTNLPQALRELRSTLIDDRLNSVTVISDGNFDPDENPLAEVKLMQCPFITIAVGDSVQQKDVLVNRVSYNSKSFTKVTAKIKAEINAYMLNGSNAEVDLYREGSLILHKTIAINSNEFSGEAEFDINEAAPGTVKYEIKVEPIKDEITLKNNNSVFLINFIDKSTKVLFISGGPGYDNAVIENILRRIEDYKVSIYTLKTPGSFYEGPIDEKLYPEIASVFFLDFPVSNVQSELLGQIAERIERFKIPLVFFGGRNADYQKLGRFEQMLPFTLTRAGNSEQSVNIQNVQPGNKNNLPQVSQLTSLPPVYRNIAGVVQKAGSEVLLIDRNSGEPLLINRNSAGSNCTSFLGYGFWKWELNPGSSNEKALANLLLASISMTLNKDKKQRLILNTDKTEFDYLENTVLTAKVFDENYQATQNATVKGKLRGKNKSFSKDVTFTASNNRFEAELGMLPADDYTFEAAAEFGSAIIGSDIMRFIVDTTCNEFTRTNSDYRMMRSIADNSGGKFHRIDDGANLNDIVTSVVNRINTAEITKPKQEKFNFRDNLYVLMLVVLLFSSEWFIKKRRNIP